MPKLRFKREDGTSYPEWNSKSFSDTFSSLNNNTFSRNMLSESGSVCNIHYGDIFVKYGEICDVQKENIPKVNDHIDTGKYDLLQDGDIILADTAEDETVGKATEILNVGTATVISGLHTMACRPNYKFAPMYLGYYINSPTYHNQLLPFMQGIKVTSIGRKNISETSISFPCLEEQQKIADFLSTVDEVIAQSEAEVANLQHQKKAAMQKIFSQEVRFKREDGTSYPEWEEKKVRDCCDVFIDGDWIESKDQSEKGVWLIQTGNVGNGVFISKEDRMKFVSNETFERLKCHEVFSGDILISRLPDPAGRACIVPEAKRRMITAVDCTIVRTNSKVLFSIFLAQFYQAHSHFKYVKGLLAGGTRKRIGRTNLEAEIIPIPCLEEQQKIADFLATYDEAISCAKQELDKWKELKKGLLQQMFA